MKFNAARRLVVILLAVALSTSVLPSRTPEEVGLSSERLQRINQLVQRYIDEGQITGAVTMVARRGRSRTSRRKGKWTVSRFIPEFKNPKVAIVRMTSDPAATSGRGQPPREPEIYTVPAERALAGIETLGRIVEIASGLTFDQLLEQRIFRPLEMNDTVFYSSEDRMARVVSL